MYNSKNIKEFKGRLVMVTYQAKCGINSVTGTILANTKERIILNVNNGCEIILAYSKIKSLQNLKVEDKS